MSEVVRYDGRVRPIGVCKEPGCWDRPKQKDPEKRYYDKIIRRQLYKQGICYYFRCDRGHTWEVSLLVSPETAESIVGSQLVCEHCGVFPASEIGCMTAYHWDGRGEDPNRNPILCEECAAEYHEYWTEMWDEYYAGRF